MNRMMLPIACDYETHQGCRVEATLTCDWDTGNVVIEEVTLSTDRRQRVVERVREILAKGGPKLELERQ